ncbi:MAG: AMP-dependent synthetase, partial [Bdellovibrio sp. CG10_big_fil_rev_8_21_14_0_10_47_8]
MTYELDWLKKWNQYSPNSIAIQDGDSGRTYSYSQFFDAATRGASYLKSCFGISQGDRVAVLSLNE